MKEPSAHWQHRGKALRYSRKRFKGLDGRLVDVSERHVVRSMLSRCDVRGRILDLPCGAGRLAGVVGVDGASVIGADVSYEMVALAKSNASDRSAYAGLVAADVRNIPFCDGFFECVLTMRLMHHVRSVEERQEVLRELHRVTRKWLVISFYRTGCAEHMLKEWKMRRTGRRCGSGSLAVAQIRDELEQAGFRAIKMRPIAKLLMRQVIILAEKSQSSSDAKRPT